MTWIAASLWDLIAPARRPAPADPEPTPPRHDRTSARGPTMRQKYDALVIEMKTIHGVRVRKWRRSSTGCAWEVHYADGSTTRLIEAPYPRGPMSCAIFLHEIGHHAIGMRSYRTRCLEEYHAWAWALKTMRERGFNVTPAVERRVEESLRYAVAKARSRRIRRLPPELEPYA